MTIVEDNFSNVTQSVLYEAIVYSLTLPLFIITAVGNGVILITLKCQARLLSSTSNYFILSLASADFLVGVAIMPIMSIYTAKKGRWIYNQPLCDLWMAVDFLCSSASFLTLSAMSIERYKMLTTSYIQIKHSSKLRIIILVSLSWFLPFSTWIPVIITFRHIRGSNSPGACSFPAEGPIVLCLSVILYHIPLICMVTFYTKLIIHIKRSSMKNLSSQALNGKNDTQKEHQQHTCKQRHFLHHNCHHMSLCRCNQYQQNNNINNHNNEHIYNQIYKLNKNNANLAKQFKQFNANHSPTDTTYAAGGGGGGVTCLNKSDSIKSRFSINNGYKMKDRYTNNNCNRDCCNCANKIKNHGGLFGTLCCCLNTLNLRKLSLLRSTSNSSNNNNNNINNNNNNNTSSAINVNFRKCTLTVPDESSMVTPILCVGCNNTVVGASNGPVNNGSVLIKSNNNGSNTDAIYQYQSKLNVSKICDDEGSLDENRLCDCNNDMRNKDDAKIPVNEEKSHQNEINETISMLPSQKLKLSNRLQSKQQQLSTQQKRFIKSTNKIRINRRFSSFSHIRNSLKMKSSFKSNSLHVNNTEQNPLGDTFDTLNYQNIRLKRNRKAARMLGILVAAFVICWSPFTVIYPVTQFYPTLIPDYINAIIWWLGYLNSAINPFLYVYSNKNIRRSVRNLFLTRFAYLMCRSKAQRNDSLIRNTSLKRNAAKSINNNRNNYQYPHHQHRHHVHHKY